MWQLHNVMACLMQGRRTSASLMVANLTNPDGEGSGRGGSRGLYNLFWQLRGDTCGVRTDFRCHLLYTQLKLYTQTQALHSTQVAEFGCLKFRPPQPYCLCMQNCMYM